MLKPATLYQAELKQKFAEITFEYAYKFADMSVYRNEFEVKDSTWTGHQFASVNKHGDVMGIITYAIDRETHAAYAFQVINFEMNTFSPTFGRDLMQATEDAFTKFNFDALRFTVVVGNPAEKMYDRHLERYGGRIVGVKRRGCRLIDNKLYDMKLYEILREDFLAATGRVAE